MSEPRIAELHFRPKRGSPWALLRVGMTESEARAALGRVDRELKARAHSGQIVFRPPLPLPERKPVGVPPRRVKTDKHVNWDSAKVRTCLCCRRPFESSGPGNRMCDGCRGRDVSPFEPG